MKIVKDVQEWWGNFLSSDNSRVNTGAVFATIAVMNALVILNWNFFVFRKPLDPGTVGLLTTMIGMGGWSYHASMSNLPGMGAPGPIAKANPAPPEKPAGG